MSKWRRTESRLLGPYGDPTVPLACCKLSLPSQPQADDGTTRYVVEPGDTLAKLSPVIELQLDSLRDLSYAGDLAILITVPERRRSECVFRAPWQDAPTSFAIAELESDLCELPIVSHWSISVAAMVAGERSSVFARKNFDFVCERAGAEFPHEFAPSEWFQNRNLPIDTVWYLDLLSDDMSAPPQDCFCVMINDKLKQLEGAPEFRTFLANMVASVFATLTGRLEPLADDEQPAPNSLSHSVHRILKKAGHDFSLVRQLEPEAQIATWQSALSTLTVTLGGKA